MSVLKQVAEEKKVGLTENSLNNLLLILQKVSGFSVVERIPEAGEVKLGEGKLRNPPGQTRLIRIFRTRRISPIPERRTSRGALQDIFEISSQSYFRRGFTRAFPTRSGKDSLAGAMPNRPGSRPPPDHVVFGRSSYAGEPRMRCKVVCCPGYGVEEKVGPRPSSTIEC